MLDDVSSPSWARGLEIYGHAVSIGNPLDSTSQVSQCRGGTSFPSRNGFPRVLQSMVALAECAQPRTERPRAGTS